MHVAREGGCAGEVGAREIGEDLGGDLMREMFQDRHVGWARDDEWVRDDEWGHRLWWKGRRKRSRER